MPGLGRIAAADPRDHRMRALLATTHPPPRPRPWPFFYKPLDQGQEGTCFPAGTLIRMADGSSKPIEDLRPLDEVVTAEGGTGRVMQVQVRQHGPGLLRLNLWGHGHLRLTAEHPILTKRGYVRAGDLRPGDFVALTRPVATDEVRSVRTAPYLRRYRNMPNRVVHHGPGGATVVTNVAPMLEEIALTAGLGRLVGLYLAEGCATSGKLIWTFNAKERDTLVADTVRLLADELGIEARVQIRPNNSINVVVGGLHWIDLFKGLLGTGSGAKALGGGLMNGPEPFVRAVLDGWLDGDGHARRNERMGVTVSHALALDMHWLGQRLGLRPAIRASDPSANRHAATRRRRWEVAFPRGGLDTYRAQQDDAATWRQVRGIDFEDFVGYVYNCEVEDQHSYVAEGIGVHNCVGHGWKAWALAAPTIQTTPTKSPTAVELYDRATELDEWVGNERDRQSGTSVRAGAKALQGFGFLTEYAFAWDVDTVCDWLSARGPVVIGVSFYDSMFDLDAEGYFRIGAGARGLSAYVVESPDA